MTTSGNYYEDLESFKDATKAASHFFVTVEMKTGEKVVSSTLPLSYWTTFVRTVEEAEAAQTALSIWDRDNKKLVLVPHNNIRYVSVVLL